MADLTFNTPEKQTIDRAMQILYLNTAEKATAAQTPKWSPIGKRVEDSSAEYDWQKDSKKDILNNTYTTMKDPIITQSFDPWELSNGDEAQLAIWNMAVKDHDAQALANLDILVVHLYAGTAGSAVFAERYDGAAIEVSSLGGAGGGNIAMPITVTYGGKRTVGTAAVSDGTVTFKPDVQA